MAVIGSIIDNKYEILKLIGRGGMSEVYLAMDVNLNKQWAVKEIKKENTPESKIAVESAMIEAGLIKELDHPSIPRIVDILDYDEVVYIIMDYIEGEPLSHILSREEALSEDAVLIIAESICNVLIYLHSQEPPIIYRDIKPDNIMIAPSGTIRMIDFGIARRFRPDTGSDTVCLGTKGYAAPEQFSNDKQSDARTDIYSLGVTMYHMITGKKPTEEPYEIYPIRYWNSKLSAGLESIIIKCTKNNPNDRYQSADELLYALWHHEELDEAYRKKQKIKLATAFGVLALSAIMFIAGIGMRLKYVNLRDFGYEHLLLKAAEAVNIEEKYSLYKEAIKLMPTENTAYLNLINEVKSDGDYSVDEEKIVREIINDNMNYLVKAKGAEDVFYQLGHTYWFYYSYGTSEEYQDNKITTMKASLPWFEKALQYCKKDWERESLCRAYVDIANFNTGINLMVEEASDSGKYAEYFNNLEAINESLSINDSELLNLEVCEISLNAIELYAGKFANDGISVDQVLALYEGTINRASTIVPTTDKTIAIKEHIDSIKDVALNNIEIAYNIKK